MGNAQGITRRYTIKGRKSLHALPPISVQETRLLELVSQIGVGRALQLIGHHLPSTVSLLPINIVNDKRAFQSDTTKTTEPINENDPNKLETIEEWEQILAQIHQKISPSSFETWFRNTGAAFAADNVLIIKCENEFQLEWLTERYGKTIQAAVHEVLGRQFKITFEVSQ